MHLRNLDAPKLIGHLAILGANIIFAVNIPIAKTVIGPAGVDPLVVSFTRFTGAMICFWIASLFTRRERVPLRDKLRLFFAGLCAVGLNQVLFAVALEYTTPLDIALINTMGPIFTLLMAAMFIREPITLLKAVGVGLGAVGAIWLAMLSTEGDVGKGSLIGIVLVAVSVLAYAIYLTLFKEVISRYHPITLMKWMFTFAFLLSTPLFYSKVRESNILEQSPEFFARLSYVVLGATFLAYLLIPIAQQRLRPTVVSMYIYVQPFIAGIVSVIVGMDTWHWGRVPAILLIFVGVFLVTQSKSRAEMLTSKETATVPKE